MPPEYKRILLKLSGEILAGGKGFGINVDSFSFIADEITSLSKSGVEIGVVIGAGNIIRGSDNKKITRSVADYMGMLATIINSIALQDSLQTSGIETRVQTAITMWKIAEPYINRRAINHLEKGRVVIFGGGTGHPYFTTDTAASLKAIEIGADILLKATKVDGIYDSDPMKNKNAKMFERISFKEVLEMGLKVMDSTAVSLCMENGMPIKIFNILQKGNLKNVVSGSKIGSLIGGFNNA